MYYLLQCFQLINLLNIVTFSDVMRVIFAVFFKRDFDREIIDNMCILTCECSCG